MDEITKMNFNAISEALIEIRKKSDEHYDIIANLRNTIIQMQQQISMLNIQNGKLLSNNIGTGPTV